jgi:hypothetical protein
VRKGTVSDWRDLDPAIRAMVAGRITFSKFAELGRKWLAGGDIEDDLPQSEAARVAKLVKERPGLLAREIDAELGFYLGRTAELCGRLRKRQQVKTVQDKSSRQIKVYPT